MDESTSARRLLALLLHSARMNCVQQPTCERLLDLVILDN